MESQIPRQRAECVLTAACITNLEFKSVSHKTHRDIIMEAFIKPAQTVQNHHNSQSESFLQVNWSWILWYTKGAMLKLYPIIFAFLVSWLLQF